jgi:hypothetical protein
MTQQVAHALERFLHGMSILVLCEIDERLIAKFALGRTRQDDGGDFCGSHNISV